MLMRMLEKGWVPIYQDGHRDPDKFNPNWYYESKGVFRHDPPHKHRRNDVEWKAVKICGPIHYFQMIKKDRLLKVLYIERDSKELVESHKIFRDHELWKKNNRRTPKSFDQEKEWLRDTLKNMDNVLALYLNYWDIIEDPLRESKKIERFLWMDLDTKSMAEVVNLKLYRNRNDWAT